LKIKIKPELSDLETYKPGKPIEEVKRELGVDRAIKLASNENPFGPSKKVREALYEKIQDVNRYPDGGCYYLREKLAKTLHVKGDQIIFGNGSDELIVFAVRALLDKGDEVIIAHPTFVIYRIVSKAAGIKINMVPLQDYHYNLEGMEAAISSDTKMIFIANPDNPTGTYNTIKEIEKFLDSIPDNIIVLIDEAYFEYAQSRYKDYPNSMNYFRKKNIIITRTFSKAYGLAGLRIGYGISQAQIIELMNKVREPFNVNSLAQEAAIAALEDTQHLSKVLEKTEKGEKQLYQGFTRLGIEYIPSATNFISVKLGPQSESIVNEMMKYGVITRYLGAWGLPEHIRITIGTEKENEKLLNVLEKIQSSF
jgi:histidinol-phosphate aminotransferase